MSYSTIEISDKNLKKLKRLRDKAIDDGRESFKFDGDEVLVTYAEYMIEHMENIINDEKPWFR